jgi:hypothetical protein
MEVYVYFIYLSCATGTQVLSQEQCAEGYNLALVSA